MSEAKRSSEGISFACLFALRQFLNGVNTGKSELVSVGYLQGLSTSWSLKWNSSLDGLGDPSWINVLGDNSWGGVIECVVVDY